MQLKWLMLWDLFSLFPAYAGVIPIQSAVYLFLPPFPRIRGGDPIGLLFDIPCSFFSPHTRG